jgi:precorrin-2 dehydrogenase/sirohydrochlorin ferrochelatase
VARDARAAGVLVNVVDRPELCDFIVPAQVRRGDLVVAVSTGGAAPSLARRLRERLEKEFGPEYATYLAVLREVREDLKRRNLAPEVRRRLFERLTEDDLLAAARRGADALRTAVAAAVAKAISETRG